MSRSLEELIAGWDGLAVVVRRDRPTGSWIFIAIHDDTLGPPSGGTRMRTYPVPAEGLADAMRLAEGMTQKWAAIGSPFGGGKAVLAVPRTLEGEERRELLRRYGQLLASLKGAFSTGPDYGTTPVDFLEVATQAPYVHGVDPATGATVDPGPYTAQGVLAAIRAGAGHTFGVQDLAGRRVLVQGLGSVGRPLARLLAEAGAEVLVSDLDPARVAELAGEIGARPVASGEVYGCPCDVYAPCATGGVLSRETIPRLACRVVAGSANNQLAEAEDARRLHQAGILYAPDFIVNAGGAISLSLLGQGASPGEVDAAVDRIGDRLAELFSEAKERGESPLAAALRRVDETLDRHREQPAPAAR